MRKLIVLFGSIALLSSNVWAAQCFEEHILVSYPLVIEELTARGLKGPVWTEMAKYALIRQAVEDGVTRHHSTSIVGMSVGGPHAQIMDSLGLKKNCQNEQGLTLSTAESYYAIKGPRANICSVMAICLLWDKYVTELHPGTFKDEEKAQWIKAKELSERNASGLCNADEMKELEELQPVYRRTIKKANGMYSSTASSEINSIVDKMDSVFGFVTD
jgi:hypothetical protein